MARTVSRDAFRWQASRACRERLMASCRLKDGFSRSAWLAALTRRLACSHVAHNRARQVGIGGHKVTRNDPLERDPCVDAPPLGPGDRKGLGFESPSRILSDLRIFADEPSR